MRTLLLTAVIILQCMFADMPCHAGGSVELSDIQPLIMQQPDLWKLFSDRLDISSHGGGGRLGTVGIPLRGYRVGPYEFPAKEMMSKEDYNLKIIITTDIYFLDKNGKETSDEKRAVWKEEVLTAISLAPLKPPVRNGSFLQSTLPSPEPSTRLVPVPDHPGVYTTSSGKQIDLRGFPPGTEVKDAYTGIIYHIPGNADSDRTPHK